MKPSIGRIVHVIVPPAHNNTGDVAPAVITRVFSDQCVNLRILHDGPSVPPDGSYRQDWQTSVPLYESREALEAANPNVSGVPFGAFWPPRVEHQPGDRPATY